jgi:hypothetical protein
MYEHVIVCRLAGTGEIGKRPLRIFDTINFNFKERKGFAGCESVKTKRERKPCLWVLAVLCVRVFRPNWTGVSLSRFIWFPRRNRSIDMLPS